MRPDLKIADILRRHGRPGARRVLVMSVSTSFA